MKLFKKEENWKRTKYNILGIKITKRKKKPSELSLQKRTKKQKKVFYSKVGYPFDPANPQTFNEKLNWLKLFYRDDDMTRIVDKYQFKNYIKEKLGDGYTVPLIGAWDSVDDIDFDKLPDKFVLKSNAQSDGKFIKIVKNKAELDIKKLKCEMQEWLKPEKTLKTSLCWAYHNVPLKIIAEDYIEQIDGQVYDYKFFCFHGEPKFIYVAIDHFPGQISKISLYDTDWNMMSVKYGKHPNINIEINKPENFDKMIEISKILSKDFPFVRVDFYDIEGKIYIGEMTFYPGGGYNIFSPIKWD